MKHLLYEIRYYFAAVILVLWLVPDTGEQHMEPEANAAAKPIPIVKSSQNKTTVFTEIESENVIRIELQSRIEMETRKNDLFPEPNRY